MVVSYCPMSVTAPWSDTALDGGQMNQEGLFCEHHYDSLARCPRTHLQITSYASYYV